MDLTFLESREVSITEIGAWMWRQIEAGAEVHAAVDRAVRETASLIVLRDLTRVWLDELMAPLPEPDLGLHTPGGGTLSEDAQADFDAWVIAQGQPLWEAVVETTVGRPEDRAARDAYDLEWFGELVALRGNEGEGSQAAWLGVTWTVRDARRGPFDNLVQAAQDRFGAWLPDML